jgi:hypothetical protein
MKPYPKTFEIDRIYKFERIRDGHPEEARLIVYDDDSASIIGAIDHGFEGHPGVWKSAVKCLEKEGFEFKEAGKKCAMEDFPPEPGEDPVDALRRWGKALRS